MPVPHPTVRPSCASTSTVFEYAPGSNTIERGQAKDVCSPISPSPHVRPKCGPRGSPRVVVTVDMMGASTERHGDATALPAITADTEPTAETSNHARLASDERKTERMSAEQFRALLQERGDDAPHATPSARPASRAATVEDPDTTAQLAALTAPPPRAASRVDLAFDTSDEPEVSAPSPRDRFAAVEMTPEMIVREPRAAREPLATMELSSDMILQIAVNGPLAVPRPAMATMELTADMILPEVMRPKPGRTSPPATPPAPRRASTASAPALPSVIVDQRGLRCEEIQALEPTLATATRATRAIARVRALARSAARAFDAAVRAIRRAARRVRPSRCPESSSS